MKTWIETAVADFVRRYPKYKDTNGKFYWWTNMKNLNDEEMENIFNAWWEKNILPQCTAYDLQIVNQNMVRMAFFASFNLFENLYDMAARFQEWDNNHPEHDKKAIEAFQAAGDMLKQILDLRIKKENLFD